MIALVLRRLLQSVLVMLVVALLAFSLFRYVGDPVAQMVGQETSIEDRDRLRESLGLNDPALVQYARFVANMLQGEFGFSYRNREPVASLIAKRLPATMELSLVAMVIAIALGIPMGVQTALHPRRWTSKILQAASLVGISLPTFLIGILLILVFGVILAWLPTFGRGEVVALGAWSTGLLTASGLKALILPSITLAVFQLTLIMRLVRSEMLEVLRADFVKFARARGLRESSVRFRHALKNTLVPVITIIGLQAGGVIAFSVITEAVFQWPGMGLLFLQAIQFVDIPVMSAYLILIAFFFVAINLVVDVLYYAVDPRLRMDRPGAGGH